MKKFVILSSFLLLGACGFQPLYGSGAGDTQSVTEGLNSISIQNIPDREGQFLRNALIDRFYKGGRPSEIDYILTVSPIRETKRDLDITVESDTTREQLRLDTFMRLTREGTDEVIMERQLYALSSFNVSSYEYATRVSENASREDALDDLARQIELQIALFMKK